MIAKSGPDSAPSLAISFIFKLACSARDFPLLTASRFAQPLYDKVGGLMRLPLFKRINR